MKIYGVRSIMLMLLILNFIACSSSDEPDRGVNTKEQSVTPEHIVKADIVGTWKIVEQIDSNGDKTPDFLLANLPVLIFTEENKFLNKYFTMDHPVFAGNYKIENDQVKVLKNTTIARTFQLEGHYLVERADADNVYVARYQKQ